MSGLSLRNTLTRRVDTVPIPADGPRRACTPAGRPSTGTRMSATCAATCWPTSSAGRCCTTASEVLHVKNITDVGHLRDERFDRGEDRMLVAAGLESQDDRPRSPTPTRRRSTPTRRPGQHPPRPRLPAGDRAHRPRCSRSPIGSSRPRLRLRAPRATVYYDVSSFAGYGAAVRQHARRAAGRPSRRRRAGQGRPADFALWKAAGEGRMLKWPTPAGARGFPGWHLECSAMALRYLGPDFEIHTGGIDNVFPHHEDEIAQSTPITGGPPVRLWVHGEHLLMAGRKMAKSAGNFERVTELLDHGLDPFAFRYLALTVALPPQARLLGRLLTRRPAALALAPRPISRALGPPRPTGRGRRPRSASGRRSRPGRSPTGVAGHAAGHRSRPHRRAPGRSSAARCALSRGGRGSTSGSCRRSTTTWTCPRRSPWSARRSGRPGRRRAPLARARRRPRARPRPRPRAGRRQRTGPAHPRCGGGSGRPVARGSLAEAPPWSPADSPGRRDFAAADALRDELAGRAGRSTGPAGRRPPAGRLALRSPPAARAGLAASRTARDPVEVPFRESVPFAFGTRSSRDARGGRRPAPRP